MKKSIWLIVAGIVTLSGAKASAQTANGGHLLSMTEVSSTDLVVTYDGASLNVTTLGSDTWEFANPFPGDVSLFPSYLDTTRALWKEPDFPTSRQWNQVVVGTTLIDVISDKWVDYGMSWSFENGAIHELDTDDAMLGTTGGGGPDTYNMTFLDLGDVAPAPDGGLTAMLLGVSFCGLNLLRRKLG